MARGRSVILFVLLSAIWGTSFMAIKVGLAALPPVVFAAVRYDVAAMVIIAYAALTVDPWRPGTREEWQLISIGALFLIAGYHAFLFVGEQSTTSATAAIIVALSPILTTVFARIYLPDERVTLLGVSGLLIGLLGVVVLAGPDPAVGLGAAATGEVLILLAAAAFALGSVLTRRSQVELPIETLEGWSMLLGAGLLHLLSLAIGEAPAAIDWTAEAMLALGYLSVVASALGFLIYFELLAALGPIEINLVSYVAPAFAALAGWLVLAEPITRSMLLGFGLIVLGFVIVKRRAIARESAAVRRRFLPGSFVALTGDEGRDVDPEQSEKEE